MIKSFLIVIIVSFMCVGLAVGQKSIDPGYYQYKRLTNEGDSLYKVKNYALAANRYSAISKVFYNNSPIKSPTAHYNAACCWALSGYIDSAFHHLSILVNEMDFKSLKQLSNDKDFESIRSDLRWGEIINNISRNNEKAEIIKKRITFEQNDQDGIFYPLTEKARGYLHNDSLPFISVNHENFRIFFRADSYAAKHLEALKSAFHKAYHRSISILDIDHYDRGINILILSGKEEMKQLTGSGPSGGFAMPGHDLVLFNYNEDKIAPPLTHEIFHLISVQSWGGTKYRLLLEGSAVYAQKECGHAIENSIYSINAYMSLQKQLYPINEIINHFDENAKENEVGVYFQSAGIFKYLMEKYGVDQMRELWKNGFNQFEKIYGVNITEFEKEWRRYIASIKPPDNVDWNTFFNEGCQELPSSKARVKLGIE